MKQHWSVVCKISVPILCYNTLMNTKLQYKHVSHLGFKLKDLLLGFVLFFSALLSTITYAESEFMKTTDLFQTTDNDALLNKAPTSNATMFKQNAYQDADFSDATSIQSVTLVYFTSKDCSGQGQGTNQGSFPDPSYTIASGNFPISVGQLFGLSAISIWKVGTTILGISAAEMSTIKSIAVTLRCTTSNTPQADFSGISFACVPVKCAAAEDGDGGGCASTSTNTQSFILITQAVKGAPADGGIIVSLGGGNNNLIAASENSNSSMWDRKPRDTKASSTSDGAANTQKIVKVSGNKYAAGICAQYGKTSKGGYTTGWFLPAIDQLATLVSSLKANSQLFPGVPNFDDTATYWSSTEASIGTAITYELPDQDFSNKTSVNSVRCVKTFVP